MRTIDLSPLYRTTVGFDRLAAMLDGMHGQEPAGYPPYNIEKTAEDRYRISVAVAGFRDDELSVESRDGVLLISGRKAEPAEGAAPTYLHRGVAERAFERRFQLADHVKPVGATVEHGLLHVDIVREVPDALKPRRIAIQSGAQAQPQTQAIEAAA